ncbi:YEATS family [Microdochium nivale]|nr:YEATS family [Microdochium nivale]
MTPQSAASDRAARRARRSMLRAQDVQESSQPSEEEYDAVIDLTGLHSSLPGEDSVTTDGANHKEQTAQNRPPDQPAQKQQSTGKQGTQTRKAQPQPAAAAAPTEEGGEEEEEEEIDEDDVCPICQLLLYDPVRTSCGHMLCSFCMATWASVSLQSPNSMTVVDVDEEPAEFDAVADVEVKCPMCRTLTVAQPDPARGDALKARYPRDYAERESEVLQQAGNSGENSGDIQTITVYIGNRHSLVAPTPGGLEENQHEWDFFVRPSRTDIVKEVHMHLHPTFRPPSVVCRREPYEVSRLGWGVFVVTADVVLKAGYEWVSDDAVDSSSPDGVGTRKDSLPLEWRLDFEGFGGKGSMARCRLKVRREGDGVVRRSRRRR